MLITTLVSSRRLTASCLAAELWRWVQDTSKEVRNRKRFGADTKRGEMQPNPAIYHNQEGADTKLLLCNMNTLSLSCTSSALGSGKKVHNTFVKKLFYL